MIKKVLEELEPLIEKYSSIAQQINIEETYIITLCQNLSSIHL